MVGKAVAPLTKLTPRGPSAKTVAGRLNLLMPPALTGFKELENKMDNENKFEEFKLKMDNGDNLSQDSYSVS